MKSNAVLLVFVRQTVPGGAFKEFCPESKVAHMRQSSPSFIEVHICRPLAFQVVLPFRGQQLFLRVLAVGFLVEFGSSDCTEAPPCLLRKGLLHVQSHEQVIISTVPRNLPKQNCCSTYTDSHTECAYGFAKLRAPSLLFKTALRI